MMTVCNCSHGTKHHTLETVQGKLKSTSEVGLGRLDLSSSCKLKISIEAGLD